MTSNRSTATSGAGCVFRARLRRFAPVAVIVLAMLAVFAIGAHRHISLETLVRHRMAIDAFVDHHGIAAVGGVHRDLYRGGGALDPRRPDSHDHAAASCSARWWAGSPSVVGATTGATIIFLIARSACGESLVRRAGPLARKLAEGFRADAFSYLLFLRLVPAFPFFLVNLVPALAA